MTSPHFDDSGFAALQQANNLRFLSPSSRDWIEPHDESSTAPLYDAPHVEDFLHYPVNPVQQGQVYSYSLLEDYLHLGGPATGFPNAAAAAAAAAHNAHVAHTAAAAAATATHPGAHQNAHVAAHPAHPHNAGTIGPGGTYPPTHQSPTTVPSPSTPIHKVPLIYDPSPNPSAAESASYLEFATSTQHANVFDYNGDVAKMSIRAKLGGTFFLSQSSAADTDPDAYHLTFYRRNLLQVRASVHNDHKVVYVQTESGERAKTQSLWLDVEVTDNSADSDPQRLLFCSPKSATSLPADDEAKAKMVFPDNPTANDEVEWKRLQFKGATAHNGRTKHQQFFYVSVKCLAELENGTKTCLASALSRPVVVRGRNPRFYLNRNCIILNDGSSRQADSGDSNSTTTMTTQTSATNKKRSASDSDYSSKKRILPDTSEMSSPNSDTSRPHTIYSKEEDYEYFPVPLNYWLPPVEVVYRPHAVHHSVGNGAGQEARKYFSKIE
ncbi:YALIA101S06e02828g1_1 [Yarrowia lipolytica]|nr:Protein pacG [Yarrowia lipolytica]SEI35135.1 YALIA101S06e02828g1_1 [Yarrowia lipolytica]